MDLDGTISTESRLSRTSRPIIATSSQLACRSAMTATRYRGTEVPSQAPSACGLIPQGAKNVAVAKDFLKYLIQLQVLNEYLKVGLARNIPCMPAMVKNDPCELAPTDPHRGPYIRPGLLGPTVPVLGVQFGLCPGSE